MTASSMRLMVDGFGEERLTLDPFDGTSGKFEIDAERGLYSPRPGRREGGRRALY